MTDQKRPEQTADDTNPIPRRNFLLGAGTAVGLPATYKEEIKAYFGKKYDKPPHSIADFS